MSKKQLPPNVLEIKQKADLKKVLQKPGTTNLPPPPVQFHNALLVASEALKLNREKMEWIYDELSKGNIKGEVTAYQEKKFRCDDGQMSIHFSHQYGFSDDEAAALYKLTWEGK